MTIAFGLLFGSALWQQCATRSNIAEETARLLQTGNKKQQS